LKIEKGKTTNLTELESIKVMESLRKLNFVTPGQGDEVVTKSDLKQFAKDIIQETIKAIIPLIQQQKQPLMIEQDYYSITAFCNIKRITIPFSITMKYGKMAAKLSDAKNIEVRKIPDERWGTVNSYHISILNDIFKI
jgi:hypothetical protein